MVVAIDSLIDPLSRLMRMRGSQMPPPILHELHEAADQLDRAVTLAHSLSGLLDAVLTASLTQISVCQNDDMNFAHTPEVEWTFGCPFMLSLVGAAVALLHRHFKKSGWL